MENEIFSAEVKIRKVNETRYGKGEIRITEKSVYLRYKKLLGKEQNVMINREDIAKVEFMERELPVQLVINPTGQIWTTLEIILKNGDGYTIMVGSPSFSRSDERKRYMQKFHTIHRLLTQDTSSSIK